ncbi:nucleotidyltransferase family protein [Shewanella basaltis]|uniref:nucleotidyltransferase domain-containing protein n=1 Tax=Shewanella basaltis TaxID=472183 RepID=UPI003AB05582
MDYLRTEQSVDFRLASLLSLPSLSGKQLEIVVALLEEANLDKLSHLLNHHRTYSCAYSNINKHNLFPSDEPLQMCLKRRFDKCAYQNTEQLGICSELFTLFKKAGVEVKILKGIPLGFSLYSNIALRHSNDLDLVIKPEELTSVDNILKSKGFTCEQYDRLSNKQKRYYFSAHKDITYRSQSNMLIELHVRLTSHDIELTDEYFLSLFDYSVSKKDKQSLELLYLCWHGCHTLFHRLKWLIDIKLYLDSLDVEALERTILIAKKYGFMRILTISWVLCHHIYGTSMPAKIESFYENDVLSRVIIKKCQKILNEPLGVDSLKIRLAYVFFQPFIYQHTIEKIDSFMHKFKPTINDYDMLPQLPNVLCYMLRPFLFAIRFLRY